jgi:hypothetical protein
MIHAYAIGLSIILGTLFYEIMERSIPTNANCSYMASPVTDYLAFLWGFIVVYYGITYNNPILTVLGSTVIVEHVYQYQRK